MGSGILTRFIEAAMRRRMIERLEDGTYYAEIIGCPGVWATGKTEKECLRELREVLEEWLLFKLRDGDEIPVVGGINLNQYFQARKGQMAEQPVAAVSVRTLEEIRDVLEEVVTSVMAEAVLSKKELAKAKELLKILP